MGIMSFYSGYLWGSQHFKNYHGYTIEKVVCFFWIMWQGCCIYVKDEGVNLNTLTTTFIRIILCDPLMITKLYFATCYGHAVTKCSQYGTNGIKVCGGMRELSIKDAQSSLCKIITWTKSKKSRPEWAKACKNPLFTFQSWWLWWRPNLHIKLFNSKRLWN